MSRGSGAVALHISGLSKVLKSGTYQFELRVPELALESGRFYGLVGKSGSGKSTLLDLLAMVSEPTSVERFSVSTDGGDVDLAGLLRGKKEHRISEIRLRNFGYILQSGGLFPFLTVRENLDLPFRLSGREYASEFMDQQLRQYEIIDHLNKKPSGLSGGQRQRVAILRALCLQPQIVLADEPTASVDENMADTIVSDLKQLAARQGTTVLMVSHDLDLVKKFADEIFTLRPVAIGSDSTLSVLQ